MTFVIARFLLGIAEAGFFPGVAYFMTCWFPSRYRGRAMGVFFAVGASAGILVGPVSANLLRLDGWLGVAGWQWVFLAEGLPTLALAAVCSFVLRDGPDDAEWLAPAEREWLRGQAAIRARGGDRPPPADHAGDHELAIGVADPGISLLTGFGVYGKALFLAADAQDIRLQQLGGRILDLGAGSRRDRSG